MKRIELLERAKPILFNTEMVRAIRDGRKTVTRRVIKLKYGNTHIQWHKDKYGKCLVEMQNDVEGETYGVREDGTHWQKILAIREIKSPYRVGDILYVRETWYYESAWHDLTAGKPDLPSGRYLHRYVYKAESPDYPVDVGIGADGWEPSIHMPKEAARIFLRVTGVRVERLQDITVEQARKEGCKNPIRFDELWNSVIKKSDLEKYGWNANPWVWVIEFERVEVGDD